MIPEDDAYPHHIAAAACCAYAVQRVPQGGAFWDIYELFGWRTGLAALHLPALVAQLPTLAAMFFVCAFGSCLDVAAIQADMEEPIDFDAELSTAGALTGLGFLGVLRHFYKVLCLIYILCHFNGVLCPYLADCIWHHARICAVAGLRYSEEFRQCRMTNDVCSPVTWVQAVRGNSCSVNSPLESCH